MSVARSDLAPQSNSVLSRNVSLGELNTKVTGPESSTDTAIPKFSGIYGKEIQNSGITIDALNNIIGANTLSLSATLVSPLIISSTVLVSNLNADLLDGKHASDFSLSTHTHTLSDLTDTDLNTIVDGDALIWNNTTNKWEAGEAGTTINSISDISDVNLISLADGDSLVWNEDSKKWINSDIAGDTFTINNVSKRFTAINLQTHFDISDIYPTTVCAISVYVNGVYQLEISDYIIDVTEGFEQLIFTSGCNLNDRIIININTTDANITMVAHTHSLNELINVTTNLQDGNIIKWNESELLWEHGQIELSNTIKTELNMEENSIVFTEKENIIMSGEAIVDWSLSNHQKIILTENVIITFLNPSNTGNFTLRIIQDSNGGYDIVFPLFKTPGGFPITITKDANAEDVLMLYYDGINYIASLLPDIRAVSI